MSEQITLAVLWLAMCVLARSSREREILMAGTVLLLLLVVLTLVLS
jgi:type II secretory pathway component PulM